MATQNFRKTFHFDDVIFKYIKKVDSQQKVRFKHTYEKGQDISEADHCKKPPGLGKNYQGGYGWKRDSPGKQLSESKAISAAFDTNSLPWSEGQGLHARGTVHIQKCHASEHLQANNLFTSINIILTATVFRYTVSPNKYSPVVMSSCSLNLTARHQAGLEPSKFPRMHFTLTCHCLRE